MLGGTAAALVSSILALQHACACEAHFVNHSRAPTQFTTTAESNQLFQYSAQNEDCHSPLP